VGDPAEDGIGNKGIGEEVIDGVVGDLTMRQQALRERLYEDEFCVSARILEERERAVCR